MRSRRLFQNQVGSSGEVQTCEPLVRRPRFVLELPVASVQAGEGRLRARVGPLGAAHRRRRRGRFHHLLQRLVRIQVEKVHGSRALLCALHAQGRRVRPRAALRGQLRLEVCGGVRHAGARRGQRRVARIQRRAGYLRHRGVARLFHLRARRAVHLWRLVLHRGRRGAGSRHRACACHDHVQEGILRARQPSASARWRHRVRRAHRAAFPGARGGQRPHACRCRRRVRAHRVAPEPQRGRIRRFRARHDRGDGAGAEGHARAAHGRRRRGLA